jgi:hypothetical protein
MRDTQHDRCHADLVEMGSRCGGVASKSGHPDHVRRPAVWPYRLSPPCYVPRRFGPRIGVAVSGSSGQE